MKYPFQQVVMALGDHHLALPVAEPACPPTTYYCRADGAGHLYDWGYSHSAPPPQTTRSQSPGSPAHMVLDFCNPLPCHRVVQRGSTQLIVLLSFPLQPGDVKIWIRFRLVLPMSFVEFRCLSDKMELHLMRGVSGFCNAMVSISAGHIQTAEMEETQGMDVRHRA
jgi:hypothetical protein